MHRVNKNAIYQLKELDGTILRMPIAKRTIKTFNKEHGEYLWTILLEVDEVHSGTEEEENLTKALSISNISTYKRFKFEGGGCLNLLGTWEEMTIE